MRASKQWAPACFLLVACSWSAARTMLAQGTQQGPATPVAGAATPLDPRRNAEWDLLQRPDVIAALRIDTAQRARLTTAEQKARAALVAEAEKLSSSDATSQQPVTQSELRNREQMRFVRATAMAAEYQRNLEKAAARALQPAQLHRLRELDLQWRGPMALSDSAVAREAGLNPATRERVLELVTRYWAGAQRAVAAAAVSPGQAAGGPPDASASVAKLRQEADAKTLAIMTPQQLRHWQAMVGDPFVFKP